MSVKSFRGKYIRKSPFGGDCELQLKAIVLFSEKIFDSHDEGKADIRYAIEKIKRQINEKADEALQELEKEEV